MASKGQNLNNGRQKKNTNTRTYSREIRINSDWVKKDREKGMEGL